MRILLFIVLLALATVVTAGENIATATDQVRATETAFARSMAERDFEAFKSFLSEDAVFLNGSTETRGKAAVAERWAPFFEDEEAPFAWAPEIVAVQDSGQLALSTGPVTGSDGERFATFTSTWRLEEDGQWRVIFDKGERYCPPPEDN